MLEPVMLLRKLRKQDQAEFNFNPTIVLQYLTVEQ
jgi:hypothetical protein